MKIPDFNPFTGLCDVFKFEISTFDDSTPTPVTAGTEITWRCRG